MLVFFSIASLTVFAIKIYLIYICSPNKTLNSFSNGISLLSVALMYDGVRFFLEKSDPFNLLFEPLAHSLPFPTIFRFNLPFPLPPLSL